MKNYEIILKKIIDIQNSNQINYSLLIDGKSIKLESVSLSNATFPVKKPDVRGGVYFSGTSGFKIKGITRELSLLPSFTDAMLGPNTEFSELEIKTTVTVDDITKDIVLLVNLSNTVQKKDQVELNMNIIGMKYEN